MTEDFRRQLLTLVLFVVLTWYTFVIPPTGVARGATGDARPDAEERNLDSSGGAEGLGHGPAVGPRLPGAVEAVRTEPADDLDWPEVIILP